MRWAILLLAAVGCVPVISGEPKPGQDRAMEIIFRELEQAPREIPVNWRIALDCDNNQGFTIWTGECANATTELDWRGEPVYIIVADRPGRPAWESLAHEVCHWTTKDFGHPGTCDDDRPLLTKVRAALAKEMPLVVAEPPAGVVLD